MSAPLSRLLGLLLFLPCSALLSHAGLDEGEKRTTPSEKKHEPKPTPKTSPSPVKAYTNDDLKSSSSGSEGSDAAATETVSEPFYSETPVLVEEEWRPRAKERRTAIETAEAAIRGLEDEAKALGLRIIMSSDTNEILDLRAQQHEQTEQLEQARRTRSEAKQALDDFETEARRASVPPGWLREP